MTTKDTTHLERRYCSRCKNWTEHYKDKGFYKCRKCNKTWG